MNILPGIRNAVRAVIIQENQLLLLRKVYEDGTVKHVLPGGAQDLGETLEQALQRECEEEIGTQVSISGLMYLADFFKPSDKQPGAYRHQIEFLFLCTAPSDYVAMNGQHPDRHQVAVEWIAQQDINTVNLFPGEFSDLLSRVYQPDLIDYLGKIQA